MLTYFPPQTDMKPRNLPKKSGPLLQPCRLNICLRKMPRLLLTKRCTLIWSIKPTLVGHSGCDAQLSHTPAALSLQFQVTKTARKLCCDPETLQLQSPIVSESLCWIKKSPALC